MNLQKTEPVNIHLFSYFSREQSQEAQTLHPFWVFSFHPPTFYHHHHYHTLCSCIFKYSISRGCCQLPRSSSGPTKHFHIDSGPIEIIWAHAHRLLSGAQAPQPFIMIALTQSRVKTVAISEIKIWDSKFNQSKILATNIRVIWTTHFVIVLWTLPGPSHPVMVCLTCLVWLQVPR